MCVCLSMLYVCLYVCAFLCVHVCMCMCMCMCACGTSNDYIMNILRECFLNVAHVAPPTLHNPHYNILLLDIGIQCIIYTTIHYSTRYIVIGIHP